MLDINGWLTAFWAVSAAVIGASGGNFINRLAWRMVYKEKASPRHLSVELLMACISVGLLFKFDVSFQYVYFMGFSFLLLAEGLVDLESYEIPNCFHVAAFIWWCLFLPLSAGHIFVYLADSLAGGLLVGGSLLCIAMIFERIAGREALGGADIKLFFIAGLYLGIVVNILNLTLSCIFGLVLALILKILSKKPSGKGIAAERIKEGLVPFGPAIGLSSIICVMVGKQITDWYIGLFSLPLC